MIKIFKANKTLRIFGLWAEYWGKVSEKMVLKYFFNERKNIQVKAFIIVLLFLFVGFIQAAEVVLKDGQNISGKIIEENNEYIRMELSNGESKEIKRSEIASINNTDEKTSKREYPVVGITYGFPAILNLVGGYYWKEFGFKVSGGYWLGALGGVQLDVSKKLIDNKGFSANLSILSGYVGNEIIWNEKSAPNWLYAGAGFEINWMGFSLEIGPVTAPPSFDMAVMVTGQIGYVHQFN